MLINFVFGNYFWDSQFNEILKKCEKISEKS